MFERCHDASYTTCSDPTRTWLGCNVLVLQADNEGALVQIVTVEKRRERVLRRLAEAYSRDIIRTGSLELRVDEVLRSRDSASLRRAVWDVPGAADRIRVMLWRVRWISDVLLGSDRKVSHAAAINLSDLAGDAPHGRWTIGRSPKCDVTLRCSPYLSSWHADLTLRQGRWYLRDLRSTNGTWIGGRRVTAVLVDGRVPVVLGDVELWLR